MTGFFCTLAPFAALSVTRRSTSPAALETGKPSRTSAMEPASWNSVFGRAVTVRTPVLSSQATIGSSPCFVAVFRSTRAVIVFGFAVRSPSAWPQGTRISMEYQITSSMVGLETTT